LSQKGPEFFRSETIRKYSLIEFFFNHSVGVCRAVRRLCEHYDIFSGRTGALASDPEVAVSLELAFELVCVEVIHQGGVGAGKVLSV